MFTKKRLQELAGIKELYPSLKIWEDHLAESAFNNLKEEQLIKEFLYTVNGEKTINFFKSELKLSNVDIKSQLGIYNEVSRIVIVFQKINNKDLDKVNKFMDSFGWFPSYINKKGKYSDYLTKIYENESIEILYESKYDIETNVNDINYLYHLTPDIKWNKIKISGLTSKNGEKLTNHPGRIYFLKNKLNSDDLLELSFLLLNNYQYKDRVKEYFLLKIDISKLKESITFYKDPNFHLGEGIWTYENIPPMFIKIEQKIDITY